jgi:hypothetical protein
VTELLGAVLGNVAVNTHATVQEKRFPSGPLHATVEEFSVCSVPRNSRRAVFSAWSLARPYNGSMSVALMSTESRTTRLAIELENWLEFRESAVEGIRLCQEDVTCAVVQ